MHAALVERPGCRIRRLAGCRAQEMRFWRFLRNRAVTAGEMVCHAVSGTGARVAGRDIVVVQDTSELALGGRRARANGYGPVGKGGGLRGLLLHAALALEVGTGALLGLVDAFVNETTRLLDAGPPVEVLHANYWLSGAVAHRLKHLRDIPLVATFHTGLGCLLGPSVLYFATKAIVG